MSTKRPKRPWTDIDWAAISRIRLGPGVIGKTSHVALAAVIVFGFLIYGLPSDVKPYFIGFLMALFAGYFGLSFLYAFKYPEFSTLEGADLVRYREVEMAANDPRVIEHQPSENVPPPVSIPAPKRGEIDG